MIRRLPPFSTGHPICIVCEGAEEFNYLSRLRTLGLWHSAYRLDFVNAKGNGNLFAVYQAKYQSGRYEIVFIFCDTERPPYTQYKTLKEKINAFHDVRDIADKIVFFGNPCTLQIVLLHWKSVFLTSAQKHKNASIVENCTGISGYKGRDDQQCALMDKITKQSLPILHRNLKSISHDEFTISSTNFDGLLAYLCSSNDQWLVLLKKKIRR